MSTWPYTRRMHPPYDPTRSHQIHARGAHSSARLARWPDQHLVDVDPARLLEHEHDDPGDVVGLECPGRPVVEERCVDHPGLDERDTHRRALVLAQLLAQRLTHPTHRPFGGRVERPRQRPPAGHRAREEEVTGAA